MKIQLGISKVVALSLIFGLCLTPEMYAQQGQPQTSPSTSSAQPGQQGQGPQAVPPAANQPPASTAPEQTQPAKPSPNGTNPNSTTIDPSQGPLQPVTTYPDATGQTESSTTPQDANSQTANPPDAPQPKSQQPSQPVGAATAERVPTAGGAAAKPAGAAIAPAKQHQTRGLLIKIGAIAAAGAALGTVYALSRSTGSLPPGAR
jgi:cytoskeletal protein RodZ